MAQNLRELITSPAEGVGMSPGLPVQTGAEFLAFGGVENKLYTKAQNRGSKQLIFVLVIDK